MTPTATLAQADATAAGLLARGRRHKAAAEAAQTSLLIDAWDWASSHVVSAAGRADGSGPATTTVSFGECPVSLAGPGAPLVEEFCVTEWAAAMGLSDPSARAQLGEAIELAVRLPRLWARLIDGEVSAWRARRVADATMVLNEEAARFVDTQVAAFARSLSPAQLDRLVDEAIARHMPDLAAEQRRCSADGRHFTIDHDNVSFAGTSRIEGELDLADALDLDAALAAGAAELHACGSTDPIDVRRAQAAGELARRQLALGLTFAPETDLQAGYEAEASRKTRTPRRDVTLFVHLPADALTADAPAHEPNTKLGACDNRGPHLITAQTVREWLAVPGTRVRVQPVIDLAAATASPGYTPSARLRTQVVLRDRTCVFPWCSRPSRRLDLDHIAPYDPTGPPGQTSAANLAPLCRHHHRAKTHGGWSYYSTALGHYRWRSPLGYTYATGPNGTIDLTPSAAPSPRPPR